MPSNQPIIFNSKGAILTVGLVVGVERVAIVEPYGCSEATADPAVMCQDLVQSWQVAPLGAFVDCLSAGAYIAFNAADGMRDGLIPFRNDFGPSEHPGTIVGLPAPNNVTGLLVYYEDPVDTPAGTRMRVGKTFMPAIPLSEVSGDHISSALSSAYQAYATLVQAGFPSLAYPGANWYRMLAAPKTRSVETQIRRTITAYNREYVATQRRRLLPR